MYSKHIQSCLDHLPCYILPPSHKCHVFIIYKSSNLKFRLPYYLLSFLPVPKMLDNRVKTVHVSIKAPYVHSEGNFSTLLFFYPLFHTCLKLRYTKYVYDNTDIILIIMQYITNILPTDDVLDNDPLPSTKDF